MPATAQQAYFCTSLDVLNNCNEYVQQDYAFIPASDVPTINQFLSVLGDALYNPTPEAILYVFTWGMGAVLFSWSLGFAVGAAVRVIRKA